MIDLLAILAGRRWGAHGAGHAYPACTARSPPARRGTATARSCRAESGALCSHRRSTGSVRPSSRVTCPSNCTTRRRSRRARADSRRCVREMGERCCADEECRPGDRSALRERGGDYRVGAPGQREADVRVEAPSEPFQVVGKEHRHSGQHEQSQQRRPLHNPQRAQGQRASKAQYGQSQQVSGRNRCAQRPILPLIHCMRGDSHRQEESQQRRSQSEHVDLGHCHCPQHHVRQVPGGVGRMQERPIVAPAAPRQRIEGHSPSRSSFSPHRSHPLRISVPT